MFVQVENAGQKEYNCLRQRGRQQAMPEQDASMETPSVDLMGYKTTRDEIFTLYQEVYQLKRAPGEYQVTQRWQKEPARRSWTHWRSIAGVGGVLSSQRRSKGEDLLAPEPLECLCRPNSMTRCRWPMTTLATFRTGSRSHARRSWG